jgi:hypothetical protein
MPRAPLAPELVQLSDSARIWPTPSVMTVTEVSIAAFDLGPIIAPEPSTWTMMLLAWLALVSWLVGVGGQRSFSETRTTTQPFLTALRVCFPDSKPLANLSFSTASRRLRPTNSWRVGDFSVYFPDESRTFPKCAAARRACARRCARNQIGEIEREDFLFQTAVTH